jgi:tetratricopeptide (TPR) repeat protein
MHDVNAVAADPRALEKATGFLRVGSFKAALDVLEPLQVLHPLDAAVWRLSGLALGSAGDLDGAVASLKKAAELRPDVAQHHYNLAVALKARGDVVLARRSVDRALVLEPTYSQARKLSDTLPVARSSAPAVVSTPSGAAHAGQRLPAASPSPVAGGAPTAPPISGDVRTLRHAVNERDLIRERQIESQIEIDRLKEERRLAEIVDYEKSLREWSWDGFVWGLGAPWWWLFWHGPFMTGFLVLFAFRAAIFITAGVGIGALIFFWGCGVVLAVYLGLRGNSISWNKRSFDNVQDFRECHKIWLVSGLVCSFLLGYATYRLDEAMIASRVGAIAGPADLSAPPPPPPPATPDPV